MKYLESYKSHRCQKIINEINSTKIGDILPESTIYQYVECLHGNDDFVDGNLGERIEWYPEYELIEIEPYKLNLDDYYLFDDLKDEYKDKYTKTDYYPPIVIDHNNILIDGNHRGNALNELGIKKIMAFRGIGNEMDFDPHQNE